MFCEKCGAQIEDGALFCEACGTKVQEGQSVEQVQVQPQVNPTVMPQAAPMPQVTPQAVPQTMAPAVPKKPMSKSLKILLVEVALLAVAVFAFFKIGEKTFSPEAIANQFFMAESKGDWNMVFDMMDLPSSSMLTKEMFLQSVEENKLKDITNYKVTEDTYSQMRDDALLKTFICEYMPSGGSYMNTQAIQLVKQKEKKWLFFDSWKVSPSSQLVEECTITIPADAEATLEGIPLEELAGAPDKSQNNVKKYTLPQAFPGKYELVVKAPYRMDYTENINVGSYNSTYIDNMQIDVDILDEVVPQCNDAIQILFEHALNGYDYTSYCDTLGDIITDDFDAEYYYENRMERLSQDDDEEYYEVMISEIEYKYYSTYNNYDTGNLQLEISAEFRTDFRGSTIWEDWWTGKITKEPMDGWYRDEYLSIRLELVDGQWKLTHIN